MVTAAGALVEAASDLKLDRVGFASPYTRKLNREGAEFLTQSGIEVVNIAYVGEDLGNYGQGELTPERVLGLGLEADHSEANGILLSCTDMRAVEVIASLESSTGKPVVTSNQAMMYCACKILGISQSVPGLLNQVGSQGQ